MKAKRDNKDAEYQFRFQVRAYGLPEPREQYRFALELGREWRFDFAWVPFSLAVEINGGIWIRGAHGHPLDILRNMEKGNDAALLGWRVMAFTPDQVANGEAVAFTEKALQAIATQLEGSCLTGGNTKTASMPRIRRAHGLERTALNREYGKLTKTRAGSSRAGRSASR